MSCTYYTHFIHVCGFKECFKYIMMNEFMRQAKRFEKGGDLIYFKRDLKYVNEKGLV